MSRWQQDAVDFACEAWAWQWIEQFARLPVTASDQIGRIGSTLELIKILADGAGGSGTFVQVYPECFMGQGLVVACALKSMSDRQRAIVWHHYVDRWFFARVVPVTTHDGREIYEHTKLVPFTHPKHSPKHGDTPRLVSAVDRSRPTTRIVIERRQRPVKQEIVAKRIGISVSRYYQIRDLAKRRLAATIDPLESKVDDERAVLTA